MIEEEKHVSRKQYKPNNIKKIFKKTNQKIRQQQQNSCPHSSIFISSFQKQLKQLTSLTQFNIVETSQMILQEEMMDFVVVVVSFACCNLQLQPHSQKQSSVLFCGVSVRQKFQQSVKNVGSCWCKLSPHHSGYHCSVFSFFLLGDTMIPQLLEVSVLIQAFSDMLSSRKHETISLAVI